MSANSKITVNDITAQTDPIVAVLFNIVQGLVDNGSGVSVDVDNSRKTLALAIRTDKDDVGKVIGRKGRIITAIRRIMSAVAAKHGKRRVNISVID